MLQYCRYCRNAEDYNGEGKDFVCYAEAPCGENGGGALYSVAKAKRPNCCLYFEFSEVDIFTDKTYSPRIKREEMPSNYDQMSLL